MITITKEKTVTIPFAGTEALVRFKVPSAIDVEELRSENLKDSDIFKKFVLEVSVEIEGYNEFPSAIISLPGSYPLVRDTALQIINAAMLTDFEKN